MLRLEKVQLNRLKVDLRKLFHFSCPKSTINRTAKTTENGFRKIYEHTNQTPHAIDDQIQRMYSSFGLSSQCFTHANLERSIIILFLIVWPI